MQPHVLTEDLPGLPPVQWFSNSYIRMLKTSEGLDWNNITLRYTQLNPTYDFNPSLSTIDNTLALVLDGAPHVDHRLDKGRIISTHMFPGTLGLIAPLEGNEARWDSKLTVAFLQISRSAMVSAAEFVVKGDPDHVSLLPNYDFRDHLLRHLIMELCDELQNGGLLGSLFAESVGNTVMLHLLRKYSNVRVIREYKECKLTPAQLQSVEEYIHEHLDQKITLADLARCIHVSVPHFEKMFRTTLHRSPYQYVLECKIEKAKMLLTHTHLTIYDVARECGFANQSHFTKHFTKFVGVSPARFVRGMRH